MSFNVGDRVISTEAPFSEYGEGTVVEATPGYVCPPGMVPVRFDSISHYRSPRDHHDARVGKLLRIPRPYEWFIQEPSPFETAVRKVLSDVGDLLIEKNASYGDSALDPVRIFSSADPVAQIDVRIDDKLSRIKRGSDYGDEDTVQDLIGYLVLRTIAKEGK